MSIRIPSETSPTSRSLVAIEQELHERVDAACALGDLDAASAAYEDFRQALPYAVAPSRQLLIETRERARAFVQTRLLTIDTHEAITETVAPPERALDVVKATDDSRRHHADDVPEDVPLGDLWEEGRLTGIITIATARVRSLQQMYSDPRAMPNEKVALVAGYKKSVSKTLDPLSAGEGLQRALVEIGLLRGAALSVLQQARLEECLDVTNPAIFFGLQVSESVERVNRSARHGVMDRAIGRGDVDVRERERRAREDERAMRRLGIAPEEQAAWRRARRTDHLNPPSGVETIGVSLAEEDFHRLLSKIAAWDGLSLSSAHTLMVETARNLVSRIVSSIEDEFRLAPDCYGDGNTANRMRRSEVELMIRNGDHAGLFECLPDGLGYLLDALQTVDWDAYEAVTRELVFDVDDATQECRPVVFGENRSSTASELQSAMTDAFNECGFNIRGKLPTRHVARAILAVHAPESLAVPIAGSRVNVPLLGPSPTAKPTDVPENWEELLGDLQYPENDGEA